MKKAVMLLTILTVSTLASSALGGTWEVVYNNPGGFIMLLEAPDADHVVAMGMKPDPSDPQNSLPTGYKMTGTGFTTFDPPASGDMFMASALQCTAPDRCYMLAMDINTQTMAMKTPFMLSLDGGNKWTTFPDPFFNRPVDPSAFTAYGSDLVMFYGSDTLVLISHDGGSNAKSWFVPEVNDVKYMSISNGFILDDDTGYLANASVTETTNEQSGEVTRTPDPVGALLKTKDLQMEDPRDMTWEALYTDQALYPLKIHFVNEQVGYMICEEPNSYQLRRTTDGGQTWDLVEFPQVGELPAIQWINDFVAFDENNLIVLAAAPNGEQDAFGVIFMISDGVTPVPVLPDPTEHQIALYTLSCVDRNLCYAGGEDAAVVKFTDDTPIVVEQDEDTGTGAETIERDVFEAGDEGGQIEDAYQGIDLAGWQPPAKSGGCSAGNGASAGMHAALLMLVACLVIFGRRRSRQ